MKKCTKCGRFKHRVEFHINNKAKDGLQTWCKVCQGEATRRRQKEKSEELKHKQQLLKNFIIKEKNLLWNKYRTKSRNSKRRNGSNK